MKIVAVLIVALLVSGCAAQYARDMQKFHEVMEYQNYGKYGTTSEEWAKSRGVGYSQLPSIDTLSLMEIAESLEQIQWQMRPR